MESKPSSNLEFSTDFTSGYEERWLECLQHLAGKDHVNYLEIGVYEGRSAHWMATNILTGKNTSAYLVDPWISNYEERFLQNLKQMREIHSTRFEVVKGHSELMLRNLPLDHFDFIYIDGSHAARNVFMDAALSWELLKNGGILIFDDYHFNEDKIGKTWGPKVAIDAFLVAFGEDVEILHKKEFVVLRKNTLGRDAFDVHWVGKGVFSLKKDKLFLSKDNVVSLSDEQISEIRSRLLQRDYLNPSEFHEEFEGIDIPFCDPRDRRDV